MKFNMLLILLFLILFSACLEEYSNNEFVLWKEQTNIPNPRYGTACVQHDTTDFYVLGGRYFCANSQVCQSNMIDVYDSIGERWKTISPMERPLDGAIAISIGGKIFCTGGAFRLNDGITWVTNYNLYSFEPSLNVWNNQLPPMPEAKARPCYATFLGKIYIMGGETTYGDISKSILTYDTLNESWETLTTTLIMPRENAEAIEHKGYIYIIGGGNYHGDTDNHIPPIAYNSVEQFNIVTQTIQYSTPLPEPKIRFAALKYKNEIYAFAGSTRYDGKTWVASSSTVICDLSVNPPVWRTDSRYQLDKEMSDFRLFLVNDRLYMYDTPSQLYKLKLPFPINYE